MQNAIWVNTRQGQKTFYLFRVKSMEACERCQDVKANFTARLEYVAESEAGTQELPKALVGVTQLDGGDLLDVYVLEDVEELVVKAFTARKPILAWVEKDQGVNVRSVEGVMPLAEPTEAEHVNYYQERLKKVRRISDA